MENMKRELRGHGILIACDHLSKSFGQRRVLRDITFEIKGGNILALVGRNGAGKTTLLKILATLITPTDGKVLIGGEDASRNQLRVKRIIGFVSSEERSFYWRLTGKQNLQFFASLHGINGKEGEKRIDMLLDAVGLEGRGDVRFREYSTGMKQSLGIARALIHDPPVLLLDEPTRSLSPDIARVARHLFDDLAKREGRAILIASHNLTELEGLADHVAILHQGTIRALGDIPTLQQQAGLSGYGTLEDLFDHFTREV
jgi:ABC-2 type transport system ATP-binding protein